MKPQQSAESQSITRTRCVLSRRIYETFTGHSGHDWGFGRLASCASVLLVVTVLTDIDETVIPAVL